MSQSIPTMTVGVPREIKTGEKRVGLTPSGVKRLVAKKIKVMVEKLAGESSGFTDRMYQNAGAAVLAEAKAVWKSADLIVKVKEPQSKEFSWLEKRHTLFTFLHLASDKEGPLIKALLKSGATAIAYETIQKHGETPILRTMSEIAGYLAGYFACYIHQKVKLRNGGIQMPATYPKDLLMIEQKFPKLKFLSFDGNVLILGGGTVGYQAACALAHTDAHIWITEKNAARISHLKRFFQKNKSNIIVVDAQDRSIPSLANKAHVIIGAVYVLARRAPVLVDEGMLHDASYHHRKLIIDVAVDQGGNVFGTHPTTYQDPLYLDEFGNLRFGVANVPSICPSHASKSLEKFTLPYVLELVRGVRPAISKFPELVSGLNIYKGKIVSEEVARVHKLFYEPIYRIV